MIEPGRLNYHLVRIKEELRKAEAKHPDFCDELTGKLPKTVKKALENLRLENGVPPFYADSILHEEICEALEAYQEGDKAHCYQELSQCGAVVLRIMEFVAKEMEAERNARA